MTQATIFDAFGREHLSSLHRRHHQAEHIQATDLATVIAANPDLIPDDILRGYVLAALEGKLRAPRGRKRGTAVQKLIIDAAEYSVEERRQEIWAGDPKRRMRGDLEPGLQAAEEIAEQFRPLLGPMSGRTLLNKISSRKAG